MIFSFAYSVWSLLLWIEQRRLSNIKTRVGLELKPLSLQEVSRYIRMIAILLQLTNKETSRLLVLGGRIVAI
jgi:hypothetical protein